MADIGKAARSQIYLEGSRSRRQRLSQQIELLEERMRDEVGLVRLHHLWDSGTGLTKSPHEQVVYFLCRLCDSPDDFGAGSDIAQRDVWTGG